YFFRDPERRPPDLPGAVVAPADGKIIDLSLVEAGPVHDSAARKVSIFMSPFNVHVNRIPVEGVVKALRYSPGKFAAAFQSKASLDNERQYVDFAGPYGRVGCVQIAGWLARRIVCHLRVGQAVHPGERYGMIRFGSRLDLYLPPECDIRVKLNDRVRAGETIVGVLHETK
ncbi:MAG: phosphatidylserine decarboxylase family protein, partial [Candidatus Zixiibacteriota bacterium]